MINSNFNICAECHEKHDWHAFYIEKNSKLSVVKNKEIAWCEKVSSFITRNKNANTVDILKYCNILPIEQY